MFPYPSQQHVSGYYHPTSSDATSNSNQYFLPPCSSPQSRSLQQYLPALPQAPVGQYHQGSWAHNGAAVQAPVVAPLLPSPAVNYAIPAEATTQGATLFYGQYPVVPCSQTLNSSGYLPSNSNSGATLGTWSVSGCPVEPYLLHLTSPPPKQAVKTEQLSRERLYTRHGNVTPTLIQKQEQMPRPTSAQVCKTALEPIQEEYAETKPDLSEKLFWKFLEVLKTYGPQEVNSEKLLNVFMNLSPHERRFIMSHGTLKEFLSTFPSLYLENGFLYLRQRGAPAEDKTISGSEKITKEETVGNINENCKNDLIEIPMHDRDSLDEIDDRDCIIPESLQQKSVFEDIARTHGISIGTAQECNSKTFPTTVELVKDQTCDSSQAVLDHIDKECVRKTTEIPYNELVQQTKYAYSEDVWKPKGIVNSKISKGCTKSKEMLRIECLNHTLTGNSVHSEVYHNDIIPYTAKDTLSTKIDAPADMKLTEVMNKTQDLENVSTTTTNQICSGRPVQHFDGKQDLSDFAELEYVIEAYEMGMKYCQKNTKDALLIAAKQLVLETLVSTKEHMKFTDRKLLDDKTPTKDEVHPVKTTGSQSVFSHDNGFKDQNATYSSADIGSDTCDMAVSQEPQLKLPAPCAETYLSPSRLKATAPEFKLKPSPLSPGGGTASLVAGDPKIISSKSETSSPSRLRPTAQEFKFKPLVPSSVPSIGGSPSRLKATVSEFVPRFKQPALSKIPDILSVQHQEQQTDHPSCYQKETGTSPRRLKTKEFSAQSAVDVAEVMINTEECLFSEESTYYVEPCQTARKSTNTEISGRIRAEPRMLSRYTSTESGSVVDRKIFDNAVTQLIAAEIKVLQLQFYLCSERLLNWFEDWKKLQNLDRYDQHVMDTLNTGKQNVEEELKRLQALYETNVRELCKGVPLESLTAMKVNLPTTQGPNRFLPREVDYNKIVKASLEHYCPNVFVDPEVIVLNERSWDRFMTKGYKKEAQKGHAAVVPEVPLPVNPDLTPVARDPLTFAGNVQSEVPTVGETSTVNQPQLPKSQIKDGASSAVGQQSDKVVSSSLQAETALPCGVMQPTGDNSKGHDLIAKIQLSNDDEENRNLLRIPTKCPPGLSNIQEPIIKKAFKPLGRRALKPRKNKVAEPKVLVSSAFETSASSYNQSNKLGNSIILSETNSKLPDMDDGISESSTLTSEEVAMPFKADLLHDAKASEMQMTTSTINVGSSRCDEMAPQKTTLGLPAVTTDLSQQQQVPQVNPVAYQYVVSQLLQMNPQLIENPVALQYIAVQQLITMQQLQTGMLATSTYGGQTDPSTLATAGLGTHGDLTALATAAYGTQSDLASLVAAVYSTQSDTATLPKAAGFGVQNDPSTMAFSAQNGTMNFDTFSGLSTLAKVPPGTQNDPHDPSTVVFSAQNGTMNFDTFSGLSTLAKVPPGTQNDRKSMSHVKSVTLDQSNFVIPQAGQGDKSAGPGKAIASISPDQQKRCFPLTGESQDKLATKEAQGDMPPYHRGAVQHSTLEVEKTSSSERCHVDCSKPFPDVKSFLMNDAFDSGSNDSKSIPSLVRRNYTSGQSVPLRYAAEDLATTDMNQTYAHDQASGSTKEYQGQLDRDRQSSISSSEGASFSRSLSSLSFETAKSPFSEQSCYESVPTSPRAATSAESNSSEYSTSTSSVPQTPRDPQNVKGSLSQESLIAGFGLLEQGAGEWKTVGSKGREQKVDLSGGQNRPSVWQTTSSTSVRTTVNPPGWNTTVSKSQSGLAISDIPPRFRAKRASESEASVERVSPVGAGGPGGGNTGQGKSHQHGKQPSIQSTGRSTPVMSISGQPLPIVQSSISNVTVNTVGASGSISNMKADKVETAKIQPYVVPGTPSSRPSSRNSEMDSIQLADSHIGNKQVEDSDEWQQVSKKKKKPDVLQEHLSNKPLQTTGSTKASNFERLIGRLMEKFPKLTRADTINLLKELRTRRGGLQGIGLAQILDEAEVVVKEWHKKPERTFESSNQAIEKEKVWQAKYKTEMCMEWLTSGKCKMGSKCNFAHGQQEVRGMQKTEMCKYFLSKAGCPYSKCIFAHDQSELCSQLPKKSMPIKAPQNVMLLSDDEDDDDDDDSYEQCVICCSSVRNPQSEKRLECGHTFHDKCISRWVLGEERTCPTCRSLALLPEEFPRLSKQ